jgi:hypothetical protein
MRRRPAEAQSAAIEREAAVVTLIKIVYRIIQRRQAAIDRLSTVKKGYWPPLIIIGYVTYAPLSGVYECPLCSHGPRGPVGV